jgi:hypothetical protein
MTFKPHNKTINSHRISLRLQESLIRSYNSLLLIVMSRIASQPSHDNYLLELQQVRPLVNEIT